ncbi:MAG: hypothetical protein R3D57_02355 [Hyphomicrobiaceae bacterium]
MIEAVMLVVLGFLAATLVALIAAPAFWARAVRLTSQRIRNSTPISEAEIRADKDLMRAEYAVKVHQLEREIEKAKLGAHRQFIEINRRDAAVTRLEGDLARLTTDRDEHYNARRVLEQTVNDRLPKLESRLEEARQLLRARDQAIGELNEATSRQEASLDEARGINAQLAGEVERLKAYLSDLGTRDRRRAADVGIETEYALRAEMEALRTRSREQAQLIASFQSRLGEAAPESAALDPANADFASLHLKLAEQAAEIARLESLVEMGTKSAEPAAAEPVVAPTLMEKLRVTEARLQRQTEQTEQIRRELDLTRLGADADRDSQVRESRALLKARLERITSELERERDLTQRLKADLTAANERAARQAAQHMEEMRRLGARTSATQRPASSGGGGLALRALRASQPEDTSIPARPTQVLTAFRAPASVRVRELNRALSAGTAAAASDTEPDAESEADATPSSALAVVQASAVNGGTGPAAGEATETDHSSEIEAGDEDRRSRLLERLRSYED